MSREAEYNGVFDICEKNNIGFVAYSPISRGLLSGNISERQQLEEGDFRRVAPRFSEENLLKNKVLVDFLSEKSLELNCTMAQLAIAWIMHKKNFIVPIPGTKRLKYLTDNTTSAKIQLSKSVIDEIDRVEWQHFFRQLF
jgi:aryl-alcohol dehydrogenase-like predicted oxidoreductase